jgi:hypothetical protein
MEEEMRLKSVLWRYEDGTLADQMYDYQRNAWTARSLRGMAKAVI